MARQEIVSLETSPASFGSSAWIQLYLCYIIFSICPKKGLKLSLTMQQEMPKPLLGTSIKTGITTFNSHLEYVNTSYICSSTVHTFKTSASSCMNENIGKNELPIK